MRDDGCYKEIEKWQGPSIERLGFHNEKIIAQAVANTVDAGAGVRCLFFAARDAG